MMRASSHSSNSRFNLPAVGSACDACQAPGRIIKVDRTVHASVRFLNWSACTRLSLLHCFRDREPKLTFQIIFFQASKETSCFIGHLSSPSVGFYRGPRDLVSQVQLIEEKTSFNRGNSDEHHREQCHSTVKIFTSQFQYILRLIPNSIIHALDSLAHRKTEPGKKATTKYYPRYGVVQLLQHGWLSRSLSEY